MFIAMLDCLLHLRQGDASYRMVDVIIGLSEVEGGDDGGPQIVPLREQRWGILGPGCEEGIRIEFCRTDCLSLRPFGWWHVQRVRICSLGLDECVWCCGGLWITSSPLWWIPLSIPSQANRLNVCTFLLRHKRSWIWIDHRGLIRAT